MFFRHLTIGPEIVPFVLCALSYSISKSASLKRDLLFMIMSLKTLERDDLNGLYMGYLMVNEVPFTLVLVIQSNT